MLVAFVCLLITFIGCVMLMLMEKLIFNRRDPHLLSGIRELAICQSFFRLPSIEEKDVLANHIENTN